MTWQLGVFLRDRDIANLLSIDSYVISIASFENAFFTMVPDASLANMRMIIGHL